MLFPLKITIFAHPNHSGCSSARLEYTSGGRVVAGSNPVIPTKLEQTAEHLFCCFFVVIALCASPPQNNKKPRTPCVPSALSVRRLVFFNIWLRDRVISIARLSACALFWLSPRGRSFLLLPSNPVIPTKPSEARRCRKTSFCFLCLVASLLADKWLEKQK